MFYKILAVLGLVLLSGCATGKCVRYEYRTVPTFGCLHYDPQGRCVSTGQTGTRTQSVCVEWAEEKIE